MRVGLLGVGGWGSNHLRTLAAMRDAGLVEELVVADADPARAAAAGKEAGCAHLTSAEELLRSRVEAVSIVTPTPTHFDLARGALRAGKHVLVEKPMTERPEEARELRSLAEQAGLILMPGHLFRYHPGVQWLRGAMARGELGEPRWLGVQRHAFREPRPDMGVLAALGVHELDLFGFLLGREPGRVACVLAGWQQPGIDEVCWLSLQFGAVAAHAVESWATPWTRQRELTAFGDRGAARVDLLVHDTAEVWEHRYEPGPGGRGWALSKGQARKVPLAGPEPLRAELEDFVRCAASGARPVADAASGVRAVELLALAQRSAREGQALPC